jgi:phage regulator Rha-like protein
MLVLVFTVKTMAIPFSQLPFSAVSVMARANFKGVFFMIPILQNKSVPTMTSREIADLTGKNHSDVKRDIENTLIQAEIDASSFAHIYVDAQNRNQKEFRLPKRECDLVVSGYSVKYRLAIIDRWQELESKQAEPQFNIPKTLPEALRLAADLADQLAIASPKVAVYELLADRKGDVSTTIIAKELGTTAIKLNRFLRDSGVKWLNADLPKAGYESWFNVVADVKNGHEFTQCLVTPDGQLKIAELWGKH